MKYMVIVMILISTNASALSTKVHNVTGMTLGANSVNVGIRVLDVNYLKHLEPYIANEARNGIASAHIEHYSEMCTNIAQRLIRLNVPVTEIVITPINIPGLGWKTKTCMVNPKVYISVD